MTRAEEIAWDGPYKVETFGENMGTWNSRWACPWKKGPFVTFGDAEEQCADLNAAYKQGQQDRWISVAERLPELHDLHQPDAFGQSEEVLVSFINQEGEREQMVDVLQRGGQGDTTTVRWCNAYGVTHWMPLPPDPEQR